MNQRELIENVAERTNLPIRRVTDVVQASVEVVTQALINGESIRIQNLCSLQRVYAPAKRMNNPVTGERIIPERYRLKFTASQKLKEKINGKS